MLVSGLIVLVTLYFLSEFNTNAFSPDHRKLNNLLYDVQEDPRHNTVLMLHLSKKARFTAQSDKTKAKYANGKRDQYYIDLVNDSLDWEKLSDDGQKFDYTVLDEAFELEKPILIKQRDMLLVKLTVREGYQVQDLTGSIEDDPTLMT